MDWLVLGTVVAVIARTVTLEEVFKEFRLWCVRQSKEHPRLLARKACYLFTCEYCFSHWVSALVLWLTGWRLGPWGFVVSGFVLVGVANVLMVLFQIARLVLPVLRKAGERG